MASNFQSTKIAFETLFNDNWIDTFIQFSGVKIKSDDYEKWINIVYEPNRGSSTGFNSTPNISYGMFYVVCWAENEFDVQDLADSVVAFIFQNPIIDITCTEYSVADFGYSPSGKAFSVLAFPIKSYLPIECVAI